jgi:hypothetical protein
MKTGMYKGVQRTRGIGKTGITVVKEGAAGGMRKMRCPNCGGLAVPSRTNNGKAVFRCTTGACRAEFTSTKM